MKKKLAVSVMTSIFMAASLAACGSSSASSGTTSASSGNTNTGSNTAVESTASSGASIASGSAAGNNSNTTIKVILKTLSSEYWNYVAKGCEQAGKDLGVTVNVLGPTSETAYDEQQSMIETTLNSGEADALVVAPQQSSTVANLISNASIPVIAIDTNVESDKVQSFVGFDNKEMGAMGGKAAVEEAKKAGWDKITAIGIAGVQGDATSEDRLAGYVEGIEAAGGTCLTDETQYADGIADKAVNAMEGIIQSHPEGISIIYCNNDDMAMGAARAAKNNEAYKNTVFLGCGGNTAALDSIEQGEETMTVAVDGYDVGYRGVQAALDCINGKTVEKFISSPASIVTKDNVDEQRKVVEEKSK